MMSRHALLACCLLLACALCSVHASVMVSEEGFVLNRPLLLQNVDVGQAVARMVQQNEALAANMTLLQAALSTQQTQIDTLRDANAQLQSNVDTLRATNTQLQTNLTLTTLALQQQSNVSTELSARIAVLEAAGSVTAHSLDSLNSTQLAQSVQLQSSLASSSLALTDAVSSLNVSLWSRLSSVSLSVSSQATSLLSLQSKPSGLKNYIINGDMRIDQRGEGSTLRNVSLASTNYYAADRWQVGSNMAGMWALALNMNASVVPPQGFESYLGVQSVGNWTSPAGYWTVIQQNIERVYVRDEWLWGTPAARTLSLSFYVLTSAPGLYGASFRNAFDSSRNYIFNYTVRAAWQWQWVNVSIPGDTVPAHGRWALVTPSASCCRSYWVRV